MAIICKKNDEGKDEICYIPPKDDVLMDKSNSLLSQFQKYAVAVGLSPEEICIQRAVLPRIILRVDKREGYFVVFHEGTQINEIKQAALTAYWILKLRPFSIQSDDPQRLHQYSRINEGFAAFYMFSACKQCAQENGVTPRNISEHLREEIMYAFTYWDLSKEAIILIAETIGESFYGISAQGIVEDGHN